METTNIGSLPRGLKVNNPGNIRKSGEIWKGEQIPSPDTAFKAFKSLDFGYRAMSLLLYNYYDKYNLDTIRKIITRYAPPTDGNDTNAYIKVVASKVGVTPDRVITGADFTYPSSNPLMRKIVKAMAEIESGQAVNETALASGYQMFVTDRLV